MRARIYIVAVSLLWLYSCTDEYCNNLIGSIEIQCNDSYENCQFQFDSVFDFDWDKLYIFEPYQSTEEMSEKLGTDCECDSVHDGNVYIFFMKGNQIVQKQISDCRGISFVQMREDGVVVIERAITFRMERRLLNGRYHHYFFKK